MSAVDPVHLVIQRIKQNSQATFGEWLGVDGKRFCYVLERPWLNNQHGVSCIPAGTYTVRRRWSQKHGRDVWGLLDVPGRTDIEIHSAADPRQLQGCIAPGTAFGEVWTEAFGDGYGVLHSRDAVDLVDAQVGDVEEWTLTIRDVGQAA